MTNPKPGHDSLLEVLSIINNSQRGLEDAHRINVSYSYDSKTGVYMIDFDASEQGIAEMLADEGFEVFEQDGRFVVASDERKTVSA